MWGSLNKVGTFRDPSLYLLSSFRLKYHISTSFSITQNSSSTRINATFFKNVSCALKPKLLTSQMSQNLIIIVVYQSAKVEMKYFSLRKIISNKSNKRSINSKVYRHVSKILILNAGQFSLLGDSWQCLKTFWLSPWLGKRVLLIYRGWRPEMLLNIQFTVQSPTTKTYLVDKYQ